jgi:5'(3')-deoxyribonucleotidase
MARILLDVDGVLAEFTHHLCDQIAQHCEKPNPGSFSEWDFIAAHLDDNQKKVAEGILSDASFWASQPLVPGAQEAVERFVRAGHDVHIVTSPWLSCQTWADTRMTWLFKNLGIKSKSVHIASSKHIYNGDIFVDDKIDHVRAWKHEQTINEMYERQAFLFDAPYNRCMQWHPRLCGWTDHSTLDLIMRMLDRSVTDRGGFF